MLREAGLEHEAHGVVQLLGLQLRVRRALEGVLVGPVRQHHVVQGHAARNEALGLGIVLAIDVAHQLGHDVLVVPGRAEGVLGHHPAFAEEDEIDIRGPLHARGRGQHGEDRRVGVIEQDRAHGAIGPQVVFHRRVIAMPGHHVERAVPDLGFMELATPLDGQGRGRLAVLEGGHGRLEIAPVGHAVGPDRPAPRQVEFLPVILTHEAPAGAFQHFDTVDQPARQDGNLLGLQVDDPKFRAEPQPPFLRHHQQLGVGRVEIGVHHRFRHQVDMACHAHLRVHVARRRHGAHARQPGQPFVRMGHRIPPVLAQRNHVRVHMRGGLPVGQVDLGIAMRMLDRGPDTIAPGALVLMARRSESRARQLLAIEAVIAFLRAVHALRQRPGQRLCLEIITEARHVLQFVGTGRRRHHALGQIMGCHRAFPLGLVIGAGPSPLPRPWRFRPCSVPWRAARRHAAGLSWSATIPPACPISLRPSA